MASPISFGEGLSRIIVFVLAWIVIYVITLIRLEKQKGFAATIATLISLVIVFIPPLNNLILIVTPYFITMFIILFFVVAGTIFFAGSKTTTAIFETKAFAYTIMGIMGVILVLGLIQSFEVNTEGVLQEDTSKEDTNLFRFSFTWEVGMIVLFLAIVGFLMLAAN